MISPKVTAATIAAAVTTLAVWGASLAHIDVPVAAQGALTTLAVLILGYVVRDPARVPNA